MHTVLNEDRMATYVQYLRVLELRLVRGLHPYCTIILYQCTHSYLVVPYCTILYVFIPICTKRLTTILYKFVPKFWLPLFWSFSCDHFLIVCLWQFDISQLSSAFFIDKSKFSSRFFKSVLHFYCTICARNLLRQLVWYQFGRRQPWFNAPKKVTMNCINIP